MAIEIRMPALSPTMEEGTLAKWLVKAGDQVESGDLLAEIETGKATMEFEAVDEGTIASIAVPEGTDGVKVGTVIATLAAEGEASRAPATASDTPRPADLVLRGRPDPTNPNIKGDEGALVERDASAAGDHGLPPPPNGTVRLQAEGKAPDFAKAAGASDGEQMNASPLAQRLAAQTGVDLSSLSGSGPNGRIVKADVMIGRGDPKEAQRPVSAAYSPQAAPVRADAPGPTTPNASLSPVTIPNVPQTAAKLTNIRRTIARRLTDSKQQVPHIYLTVDVRLDALLKLRADLNAELVSRGVKLSVNDLLVKVLAAALIEVPACNVMFTPDQLISFDRADISVAVSTPTGLITPVVVAANEKSLSAISTEIKELAALARENKLKPEQYQGGTASISNMGMYGITQFDAVINPPQGMILAVGAGVRRPWVIPDDSIAPATVMSTTGSFDHRAIDGADAANLMRAIKALVESPMAVLV